MFKEIKSIFLVLLVIAVSFLLLAENAYAENKFDVLANVNNEVITRLDVEQRFDLLKELSKNQYGGQNTQSIKDQILILMVEEKLKLNEAKKLDIDVTDSEISKAIAQIESLNNIPKGTLYEKLRNKRLSKESLLNQIKSDIVWQKIVYQKIAPTVDVKEYEVDEAIEYMLKDSKRKLFNLSEIFVPIYYQDGESNKAAVQKAVAKIVEDIRLNNNFDEMVRQFSRSNTSSKDGKLGWVEQSMLSDEISEELSKTSIHGITNPIFVGNDAKGGYYIFQINDVKVEQKVTDKNRKNIMNYIYRNKVEIEAKNYMDNLYKDNFINIKLGY